MDMSYGSLNLIFHVESIYWIINNEIFFLIDVPII